jgi:hypothetical protein
MCGLSFDQLPQMSRLRPVQPKVQLTKEFREALEADGADPDVLRESFAAWKQDWPYWEDRDYYFGKDGDYHTPKRGNRAVLRHVHMPPEDPQAWPASSPPLSPEHVDKVASELASWDKAWNLGRAARYRTSSRVLVYVDGGRHGYLLLHLAREPEGHDEVTANARVMERWADIADAFIHFGTVPSA